MRASSLRRLATLALVALATGTTGGTSLAAPRADGVAAASLQSGGLEVELYCSRFFYDMRCSTTVYGGTGSYSYSWIGAQPVGDGSTSIAECSYGQYHYVEVLVTDSNGSTGNAWIQMLQC